MNNMTPCLSTNGYLVFDAQPVDGVYEDNEQPLVGVDDELLNVSFVFLAKVSLLVV